MAINCGTCLCKQRFYVEADAPNCLSLYISHTFQSAACLRSRMDAAMRWPDPQQLLLLAQLAESTMHHTRRLALNFTQNDCNGVESNKRDAELKTLTGIGNILHGFLDYTDIANLNSALGRALSTSTLRTRSATATAGAPIDTGGGSRSSGCVIASHMDGCTRIRLQHSIVTGEGPWSMLFTFRYRQAAGTGADDGHSISASPGAAVTGRVAVTLPLPLRTPAAGDGGLNNRGSGCRLFFLRPDAHRQGGRNDHIDCDTSADGGADSCACQHGHKHQQRHHCRRRPLRILLYCNPISAGQVNPNTPWTRRLNALNSLYLTLEHTNAYVSTLGGGAFLCRHLGFAVRAARTQMAIARMMNDHHLYGVAHVHLVYVAITAGRWAKAKQLIRQLYAFAVVTDDAGLVPMVDAARVYRRKTMALQRRGLLTADPAVVAEAVIAPLLQEGVQAEVDSELEDAMEGTAADSHAAAGAHASPPAASPSPSPAASHAGQAGCGKEASPGSDQLHGEASSVSSPLTAASYASSSALSGSGSHRAGAHTTAAAVVVDAHLDRYRADPTHWDDLYRQRIVRYDGVI